MRKSIKRLFSVRKSKGNSNKDTVGTLSQVSESSLPLQQESKTPESSKGAAAAIQNNESVATARTSVSSTAAASKRESAEMSEKPDEKPTNDTLLGSGTTQKVSGDDKKQASVKTEETDDAHDQVKSYDKIPVLEQTKLPTGGVSVETAAVGRVQVRTVNRLTFCLFRMNHTFLTLFCNIDL